VLGLPPAQGFQVAAEVSIQHSLRVLSRREVEEPCHLLKPLLGQLGDPECDLASLSILLRTQLTSPLLPGRKA